MEHQHYFKEWRKHRALTQDQVIGRLVEMADPLLPQTAASLSRYENGKVGYNERIIHALAEIYNTEVWRLLRDNPLIEGEVLDFGQFSLEKRKRAFAILEALEKEVGT